MFLLMYCIVTFSSRFNYRFLLPLYSMLYQYQYMHRFTCNFFTGQVPFLAPNQWYQCTKK